MPRKLGPYRTYGEKLVSLFARLLFSGEEHSLAELARMLSCSKQTVLRLIKDIEQAYGVEVSRRLEGNRRYVKVRRPGGGRGEEFPMTPMELAVLGMCRDFTARLLGPKLFEEATRAILKSRALLPAGGAPLPTCFGSLSSGAIDYTPHQGTIRTLIEALEGRKVLRLAYRPLGASRTRTFETRPLKLFAYKDAMYLHALMHLAPGVQRRVKAYDPLLAVHRIRKAQTTGEGFAFPEGYDFEKEFARGFGILRGEPFTVEAEFIGWAAAFVSERTWGPGQKLTRLRSGRVRLRFTAASEPEVVSWILSFGDEARVLNPAWIKKRYREEVKTMFDG